MRYFVDGKILRRSTKTTGKSDAIKAAKAFYDEINYNKHIGDSLSASNNTSFEHSAKGAMEMQLARVSRGELTKMVHDNDEWRQNKHVLPFFAKHDVAKIDYFELEKFLLNWRNFYAKSARIRSASP